MDGQADLEEFYRTNAQFQKRVLESPNIALDNGEDFEADLTALNKQFLDTCVQNLRDVGRDCSLAPVVSDYMRYTIDLLGAAAVREGEPAEFFLELGAVLHQLIDNYYLMYFKMEQQNRDGQVYRTDSSLSPYPSPNAGFETLQDTSPMNCLPDAQSNPLLALRAIGYQKLAQSKELEPEPRSAVIPKFGISTSEPATPMGTMMSPLTSNGNTLRDRNSWAPSTAVTMTTNSFEMNSANSSASSSMFTGPGFFSPSPTPATTNSSDIFSVLPARTAASLAKSLTPSDLTPKSNYQNVPDNFSFNSSNSSFKLSSETPPVVNPSMSDVFVTRSSSSPQTFKSSPSGFKSSVISVDPTNPTGGGGDGHNPRQDVSPSSVSKNESEAVIKKNPFTALQDSAFTTTSETRPNPFTTAKPLFGLAETSKDSIQPFSFTSKDGGTTSAKVSPSITSTFSFKPDASSPGTASGFSFKPVETSSSSTTSNFSFKPVAVTSSPSTVSGFSFKPADTSTPKGTIVSSGSSFKPPVTSNGSIFGGGSGLSVPSFNTAGTGLFGFATTSGSNTFSTPSTSSAAAATAAPTTKSQEPDEDDEKEKEAQSHEFTPVVEEDALFSIKSKIFEWNGEKGSYVVRGLGMLHIRKLDNQSYQLIVRADNALGNVLLNMKLAAEIPIAIEKNNLKTIDPHKSPPQRILIRVRLETEAQTLLDRINQYINTTTAGNS